MSFRDERKLQKIQRQLFIKLSTLFCATPLLFCAYKLLEFWVNKYNNGLALYLSSCPEKETKALLWLAMGDF